VVFLDRDGATIACCGLTYKLSGKGLHLMYFENCDLSIVYSKGGANSSFDRDRQSAVLVFVTRMQVPSVVLLS
jgi:hypothetical protein